MALLTTTTQAAVTELIKPTVLLTTVGSGPFGERSPASHIHTLTGALPPPLQFSLPAASKLSSLPLPQRKDIDIGPGGLAFLVDNVMSSEQCDALAAVSESIGYSRFAPAITTPPGMRQNSAAHWLPTDQHADEFLDPMYHRFAHLLPPSVSGGKRYGRLSRRLAHSKYDDGDVFNMHTDGQWPGQGVQYDGESADGTSRPVGIREWPGVVSKLSMLLYLNDANDGVQGGATRLFHTSKDGTYTDVAPTKGSALFFRHGFGEDSVLHMGTAVSGEVPKYIVRLNVLYDDA